MSKRGEYTPIQLSFDLGPPIHREALFQVLLTMEQEVEKPAYDAAPQKCCQQEGCCEDVEADEAPVPCEWGDDDYPIAPPGVSVEEVDDLPV